MSKMAKEALKFLLAVFEQSGSQSTPELARLLEMTFGEYDSQLLMKAGVEAMKQSKGRVTIAELQKHVDLLRPTDADEHPSAEEAWALVPHSEDDTTYMTTEMMDAVSRGGVNSYLERRDFIGAERAFKKLYDENVAKSRAAGSKAKWHVTVGHDRSRRVVGLEKAVSKGIINSNQAYENDPDNEAIYLSAEKQFILRLPEAKQQAFTNRLALLQTSIKQLVAAREESTNSEWKPEREPSKERLADSHVIARAASLGLTPYEYLVIPMPPQIAAKVHAQLSKQYGINLESMTKRRK